MDTTDLSVVTGAFGYTGKYIARRLLAMGGRVRTLTGHPDRPDPFGGQVSVAPLAFDSPAELVRNLRGASVLYNTYWVRFAHGPASFDAAVENTLRLFRAAEEAGVRKVVHISILNAAEASPLPYFSGKGLLERHLLDSPMAHAILRPTVIFGAEDILINNIAWLLRRFPLFAIPGDGRYRLQPIFVEDVAEMAVRAAAVEGSVVMDAVGPEIFTFDELLRLIRHTVRSRAAIVHMSPPWVLLVARLMGSMLNDVLLTSDEVEGLMSNLLVSAGPPTGRTRLSDWLEQNAGTVGTKYASELGRHYR